MAQIHVLDSETIDKIAAGEVVERPASVVKELVENAIDAGATAITVEARDGGIEFLRITDNGSGMEADQIRTAFLRHATSKIESSEDLTRIGSLGFRGEALSSIAAVSKVEVITKTKEALTGIRFCMEGAIEQSYEEVGAPEGTTFIMRNLFFNTPVRRKFLKQPATEGGYITDLMEHLALSRPDISFKFVLGSQVRFHTSGNGDLKEVIYRIYGRDIAAQLVPIQREAEGIRIEGYLGKPILVRSNRNFEIYFINGRFIKSQLAARAIEEGYKQYLMQHKFPLCVLHISMEKSNVDVNVHPNKMDVRFSDGPVFCNQLAEAIRGTLHDREMIPDAALEDTRKEKNAKEKEKTPEPFEKVRRDQYRVMEEVKYEAQMPGMQELVKNPVWSRVLGDKVPPAAREENSAAETVALEGAEKRTPVAGRSELESTGPQAQTTQNGMQSRERAEAQKKEVLGTEKSAAAQGTSSVQPEEPFFVEAPDREMPAGKDVAFEGKKEEFFIEVPDQALAVNQKTVTENLPDRKTFEKPQAVKPPMQLNLFEEKLLSVDNRSRYQIIGQVFDTYWIVQFEDKMFIIDQHAAHEKVKYERLMKRYREGQAASQALMPPIIVSLTGQEELVLQEYREVFCKLGFEVEAFGGTEYALRAVPTDLYGCEEKEMFLEVLDELSEGGSRGGLRVVEEKIASMSCKAAVKGNNRLSRAEAEMLIDELLTLDNPYNCPHGRPTIISMTKYELEKKFKRIV